MIYQTIFLLLFLPPFSVLTSLLPPHLWPTSLFFIYHHFQSHLYPPILSEPPFAHCSFTLSWFLLVTWSCILTCEELRSTDEREAVRFVSQSNIVWVTFNLIFSRTISLHSNVISFLELNNIPQCICNTF